MVKTATLLDDAVSCSWEMGIITSYWSGFVAAALVSFVFIMPALLSPFNALNIVFHLIFEAHNFFLFLRIHLGWDKS